MLLLGVLLWISGMGVLMPCINRLGRVVTGASSSHADSYQGRLVPSQSCYFFFLSFFLSRDLSHQNKFVACCSAETATFTSSDWYRPAEPLENGLGLESGPGSCLAASGADNHPSALCPGAPILCPCLPSSLGSRWPDGTGCLRPRHGTASSSPGPSCSRGAHPALWLQLSSFKD